MSESESVLLRSVRRLLTDSQCYWILASLVIVGDAILMQLVIHFVPCRTDLLPPSSQLANVSRHRDRLEDVYVPNKIIPKWRAQLFEYIRADRGVGVRSINFSLIEPLSRTIRIRSRYPAGHVYIHDWLFQVTESGSNLALAQQIYAVIYMLSLVLSCAIYRQSGSVPNWTVLLLPLSKRLHSIYSLRLFNDCWVAVLAQSAVLAYGRGLDVPGTVLFR